MHVARQDRADGKICSGRDLATVLVEARLVVGEAKAWRRDLGRARKILKPPVDGWRILESDAHRCG